MIGGQQRRRARAVARKLRDRGLLPRGTAGLDAAIDHAQEALARQDWPTAAARWQAVIDRYEQAAPEKAYARLALAHRELGDLDRAEAVLERGRARHPDDPTLAIESAQLATTREDWPAALARWTEVLERFDEAVSWKVYARLATAYRLQGDLGIAAAILEQGCTRFPDDPNLAVEWAQLAMVEERWQEAVVRWEQVLDRFRDAATWKAYARLSIAYREQGDIQRATELLVQGRERFPDDPNLALDWALLAMVELDWEEAVARWHDVLDRHEGVVDWKVYARLANCQRQLGRLQDAARTVDRGRRRFPDEPGLTAEWAEEAMVREDWPEAVARWQQVLEARAKRNGDGLGRTRFPRRGAASDWYEIAWQTIVREWDSILPALRFRPGPELYLALARTLQEAELPAEAGRVLDRGVTAHPADAELAFETVVASLEEGDDAGARLAELSDRLQGSDEVAATCRALAGSADGDGELQRSVAAASARNAAVLRTFADEPADRDGELGSIRVIRYPRGSSIEVGLRAGRYLSDRTIQRRVAAVSSRDGWPEMTADENLLMRRARRVCQAYAERFEDLPYLPAAVLAEAVLFLVYHELCLQVPMRRLAEDLAAQAGDDPVFLEVSSLTFRYLDGYTYSNFDVLYLYFELRLRGVNAFLCRPDTVDRDALGGASAGGEGVADRRSVVRLRAGARALRPQGVVSQPAQHSHRHAVVPSGIRAVSRVLDRLGAALVYSSGSVVKEFAYDRSFRQGLPFQPTASIHPSPAALPTVQLDLWSAANLSGVLLTEAGSPAVGATIEVSPALGGDWLSWLDRVLHPYLAELSMRAHAEVAARGITEGHVCDHLFAEPALYAHAVKQRGGRVTLWPHSANPVHVDQRRPGSFDVVHAVTRAGCDRWRRAFPDVEVVHSPELMLNELREDSLIDPSQPLSVVVMGGRSQLRHLPILDREAHERSYRALFSGIEALQERHDIDLYFKPRGLTGEHEMWLAGVVGRSGAWRRVLQHPMRIQLPNVLFVSVSMGTSALLEGLSRGIPGLVVRDFAVRDYTTLDEEAFATGPVPVMLERIRACTEPGGLRALLDEQLRYYRAEVGAPQPTL